ncbi:MAG: 50S ribosomal protein L25 [Bacteroidetes bacterium ADurb.Bin408]|nr:MAG: 50S ribosomal protein L25 [Bacteroidetes bacterium ADurb.Bin408]
MKKVSISGSPRVNVGKKDAKANRNKGLIPAVLYGGKEQFTLTVEEKAIVKLLSSPEVYTLGLNFNNKEYNCIIKETQFHPVTDKVIHVDFLEIFENKPVILEIPVKLTGTSPGVLMGGKLQLKQRKLKVKGIYTKLPDYITLDISSLEIGDSIKIGNIKHEHLELLDNPSSVVVAVKLTRAGVSAAQEEEAAAAPAAEQKETKE